MPFVLRQSQDEDNPRLPDAYGKQITAGRLVYYEYSGTAETPGPTKFIVFLCRGGSYGCDGLEGFYYGGMEVPRLQPGTGIENWVFHPGTVTTQIAPQICTIEGKPKTVYCVGHGYLDDDLVRFRALDGGTMPAGVSAETVKYRVSDADADTFRIKDEYGFDYVPITTESSGTLLVWKADAGIDDPLQGKPKLFPNISYTFSGICYVEGYIPAQLSTHSEPDRFKFIVNCRKIADYNSMGVLTGTPGLSANNARVAADLLLQELKLPNSRIDWTSWSAFKAACDQQIWYRIDTASSFTTGPGLTGKYYNHADMGFGTPSFATATLAKTRGGEEINFDWSNQAPDVGVNADWFLVRWDGKIRPAYTELYTFKVTADDGIRLWVGDVGDGDTPLIDRWNTAIGTDSATIELTKNELIDIRMEFYEAEEGAHVFLRWSSQSQIENIVPKSRLYPPDHPVKRYEAHLAMPSAMTAWQAFEEVMERAPGWHWQDVSGKIVFLGPDRPVRHHFNYDPTAEHTKYNIASKTFEAAPRPPDERINYQRYEFRDVESVGYAQSYIEVHRTELRELQGGLPSDTPLVRMGVMTRSLAERIAETRMKLLSDPERQFVLRGQLDSYKISKGDRVTLSHFLSGDTYSTPVDCIVTAETTGGNADEKTYTLLPVVFPFYEDEPYTE